MRSTRTWVSASATTPIRAAAPRRARLSPELSRRPRRWRDRRTDPGGFGEVTITKAITIDGGGGQVASVLYSGTNGIVVSAGPSDIVKLRNLSVNGIGATVSGGLNGIVFHSGSALQIENCNVMNNTVNGIQFVPSSGASKLHIVNTFVSNNTAGGILVAPTGTATTYVSLNGVQLNGNGSYGLKAAGTGGPVSVSVVNSQANGNASNGVNAVSGPSDISIMLSRVSVSYNGTNGLHADNSLGGNSTIRVGYSTITGNNMAANAVGSSSIRTYGNNQVDGNITSNGTFTGAVLPLE